MLGYFVYCRKSSEAEDRQVLSNESQTREMTELGERRNLPIAEIFTESKSAKEPGRPEFNRMMERLKRGEAAGVLCWKLDRLARNPVDGGAIIWAIKQHGVQIITPTQTYSRTEDNTILMYVEFGMAQKYIDDLSKNVKRGLQTKIQNGWYPGVALVGYLNYTDKLTGENYLIKDPERFPLVRRMWDLMLTGLYTPPKILQIANGEWGFRTRRTRKTGGKPLALSTLYHIFSRPFYYGYFEHPTGSGRFHQGKHEPMVTRDEFNRVQALLKRGDSPRPQKDTAFAFTGLIHCGTCARMVTAEEKHQVICDTCRFKFAHRNHEACPRCQTPLAQMVKPLFLRYTYYHCSRWNKPECREKCLREDHLEEQIDQFLRQIEIAKPFKDWAIQYLHELHEKDRAAQRTVIQAQEKAYQQCQQRIENLVRLKTAPENVSGSLLSDEEYALQRSALLKEKQALEEALKGGGTRAEECLKQAKDILEFASSARERFAQGDAQTKKEILATVGSNLTLKGKKLFIEAKKPFLILGNLQPAIERENEPIEPENPGLGQGQKRRVGMEIPCGLRDVHDVRTHKRKWHPLMHSLYQFLRRRSSCPCHECQNDPFDTEANLAQRKRFGRWGALSVPRTTCLFDRKSRYRRRPWYSLPEASRSRRGKRNRVR